MRRYIAGRDGAFWRVLDTHTREYVGEGYPDHYKTSRRTAMRFADRLERERDAG